MAAHRKSQRTAKSSAIAPFRTISENIFSENYSKICFRNNAIGDDSIPSFFLVCFNRKTFRNVAESNLPEKLQNRRFQIHFGKMIFLKWFKKLTISNIAMKNDRGRRCSRST
jgi:hypothetical protein